MYEYYSLIIFLGIDDFLNEAYLKKVITCFKNKNKIGIYNISFELMHGLGTPEDLELYHKYNRSFSINNKTF